MKNIERSSGNVFRDLGLGPKEAESLRLRARLMAELKRLIQTRKLTQNSAAKLLGVPRPRISDLVRGKIELFSIETLVDMLTRTHGIRRFAAEFLRIHPGRQFPERAAKVLL